MTDDLKKADILPQQSRLFTTARPAAALDENRDRERKETMKQDSERMELGRPKASVVSRWCSPQQVVQRTGASKRSTIQHTLANGRWMPPGADDGVGDGFRNTTGGAKAKAVGYPERD